MNNYRTMKELPETERPYEKCMNHGAGSLSDAELLAVVLRCGSRGETVGTLSVRLLSMLHEHGGLHAMGQLSVKELCACKGIGSIKAVQLQCVCELAARISREKTRSQVVLGSPSGIAAYFMESLRAMSRECVITAFFSTKGHLLHWKEISRGTVNASLVTPREVYLEALRHQAVYVVLIHNHPSGDPTPSPDDLDLTEQMMEAGRILQIPLMDHIIIGDQCYTSLKEQGFIP